MNPLLDNFFNRQILAQYGPSVLAGFWVTVEVALLVIAVGVALGLALAIVRTARWKPADIAITGFVDIFRTLPQLVVIVFLYFGLPYADIQLSPFAATVRLRVRSPCATAVTTSAMSRTWLVRLVAIMFTLSDRSFQMPPTPFTWA